jgi:hypothetical protein
VRGMRFARFPLPAGVRSRSSVFGKLTVEQIRILHQATTNSPAGSSWPIELRSDEYRDGHIERALVLMLDDGFRFVFTEDGRWHTGA